MGALLLITAGVFFKLVVMDGVPAASAAIPFVLLTTIGSIVVQIVLALMNVRDAGRPADEREALITDRAGHWSSYVLGVGVIAGLGQFMFDQQGETLFLILAAALIASQILEYCLQIFLFRRPV